MEDDGGLLVLLFSSPHHLLWCVFFFFGFLVLCGLFFSVLVLCFFFLPYFVGFQLFGLMVAQEAQNQVDNPINQVSKNSGYWLSGYLLSEKMAEVRYLVLVTH